MRLNLKSLGGAALVVALAAALLLLVSGPGYRLGAWPVRTGITLVRWGAYGGLLALVIGGIALWRSRGRSALGALAVVLALGTVAIPLGWQRRAAAAPPIHDITTDTANPPVFHAIVPLRAGAPNTLEYSQETARQQREAYPDITPLILERRAAQVFDRALNVAGELGWEIVDANADAGRIEATDTTAFFGFKDDVVVRLTPMGERTVVDVRSVSRVGRGDAGTNARRIREFLAAVARP